MYGTAILDILLNLIKRRITPIIKKHFAETQTGFRKGKSQESQSSDCRQFQEEEYHLLDKYFSFWGAKPP